MTTNPLLLTLKTRGDRVIGALDRRTRGAWARRDATVRDARDALVTRAQSALEALTALPPRRLKAALYGLWLVEAYVVATISLTVLTQFSYADAFRYDRAPDQSGLVFLATILLPSLILGARWLHREATVHETELGVIDASAVQRGIASLDSAYRALHLYPDAPLHVAEAAYIASMKRAHPDVPGGSNDEATRLTLDIEIIRASDPARGSAAARRRDSSRHAARP